jgi:hypothetical protein
LDTKVPDTRPAAEPPSVVLLKLRVRMSLTPAEVGVEPSWNAIVWVDGVIPPGVSQVPEKVIGAVPSETVRDCALFKPCCSKVDAEVKWTDDIDAVELELHDS